MDKIEKHIKTFLISVIIIVTTAMIFKGITQIGLSMEIGKSESIDTTYTTISSSLNLHNNTNSQENYEKPNYKLVDGGKPTNLDITREEAAEIGVQNLYSVFGLDMNDKIVEMEYFPAEYHNRSKWRGTFKENSKENGLSSSYSFYVDSISGEMISVEHNRILEKTVKENLGFDANLEKNAEEYEKLAKELSVKLGIIQSTVKTAEYKGQGTGGLSESNDPTVHIEVTGENGDRAILTFSRYDRELIGIQYNIVMKDKDAYEKRREKYEEFEKRAEEYFRLNPDASYYSE